MFLGEFISLYSKNCLKKLKKQTEQGVKLVGI